ncbi:PhoX family phosphatase [Knoellia sp. 3-2P3]|uniref:PhoX family protein n=1 Tax=unclassified Knoellia TaxID=2618719 RepID=UPI0023DA0116|nr:PhoX family phosphatase [Knoellia sp. 3-2P3]MDF2093188.1 PhoX family phosphatase [Knoellia sp. 3-2P3]
MTAPAPQRTVLPLTPTGRAAHPGGRSAMTCHFRCDDACSKPVPNPSDNTYFGDVVAAGASRRSVLKGGGLVAAVVGLTAATGTRAAAAAPAAAPTVSGATTRSPFGFTPIAAQPEGLDKVVVPDGFTWSTIISWGDPILAGAPDFDFDRQSAAAQEGQFGYNNDYIGLIRTKDQNAAVLVANNEYTNDELMFRGYTGSASLTPEQIRITMAAHGMSVVEVRRKGASRPWEHVKGAPLNRRVTATTAFAVDGPAAGHPLLQTSADPSGRRVLGTIGNCAGGTTPWGTVLSGEENFQGYFKASSIPADQDAAYRRYGITGSGRGWERVDDRFDTGAEPNEVNRFGYVVELDPSDPTSTPVKHTALGRLKHEGANVTIAPDGRVVAYTGDDERFDYLYKFVSHGRYRPGDSAQARANNLTLLSSGDLYVAKFTGDGFEDGVADGTGTWLPLVVDNESQVPGMTVAEVLIWTRLAADKVGPTKMDRPEDVETNPVNGRTYVACTNNTRRVPSQIDEANPRANNKHGHIIEITPDRGNDTTTGFSWKIVLVAGDPSDPATYFNGYDRSEVSPISCPDNVAFDREGNLWIATDGNALGHCDGMYLMPLTGTQKGHLQQFLSVPAWAECCGPLVTWDDRTVLAAVQHPGEVDGASPDNPRSQFPYRGDGQPRPSVIQVHPA